MKKQIMIALGLLLLIPVVLLLGGWLSNLINPEMAARHANYARNFYILSWVKNGALLAAFAVAGMLWVVACFLMIQAKGRSWWWLLCAALGPIGFGILAALKDREAEEADRYAWFVGKMKWWMRAGYEVAALVILWELPYQGMVLKRYLMIRYESAATGVSAAEIIATQNASSGMWAFGEGLEVMYLVVLLYVLRPILFNIVSGVLARAAAPKAQ